VSDKTEEPTPRRLRKAREEGDSGVSAFAAQSVAFVVAVALAPAAIRALASYASNALRDATGHMAATNVVGRFEPIGLATAITALTLPILAASGLAAGIVLVVQTGGIVAPKRIGLRLERLNPIAGMRGLFSTARLFAVARSLAGGAIVCGLAWSALNDHLSDLGRIGGRVHWVGVVVSETGRVVAWRAALVGLALGFADLLVTRRGHRKRLRMTRYEVKREYKESEGDPLVRAARERAYQELLAQAAIGNVRTASVVIVNPTHLACALRYDEKEGDEAPAIVASGEGELAARIVRAARDYGIPVVRDVPLARALIELEAGDVIPEALYEAVAEILREIWEDPDTARDEMPGDAR
jgi:type III secretion protein U